MKKKKFFLFIIFIMCFLLSTERVHAGDAKTRTLSCSYTDGSTEIVIEFDKSYKTNNNKDKINIYRGGYLSSNRIEHAIFNYSDKTWSTIFNVTDTTIECNNDFKLYEVIIKGSNYDYYHYSLRTKDYDSIDDWGYGDDWDDLDLYKKKEDIGELKKYTLIKNSVGQSFVETKTCEYRDSKNNRTITVTMDADKKFKAYMDGKDEYWLEDSDGGRYIDRFLNGTCYKYAVAEHDGYSRIHLVDDLNIKEITEIDVNKIDINGTLINSDDDKSVDQLKQEAVKLGEEFKKGNQELTSLTEQYNSNQCEKQSKTEVCKNLSNSIMQKKRELDSVEKELKNNPYGSSLYENNELRNQYNNIVSSLVDLGFTQYSGEDLNCTSIQRFSEILKDLLKLIRVIGVVLFLALGAVDFAQAIISGEQDLLKKASGKFTKRAIAVVILFFLPIVLEFILKLAGISSNPLCGIGL